MNIREELLEYMQIVEKHFTQGGGDLDELQRFIALAQGAALMQAAEGFRNLAFQYMSDPTKDQRSATIFHDIGMALFNQGERLIKELS